jgi:hypothetical protein
VSVRVFINQLRCPLKMETTYKQVSATLPTPRFVCLSVCPKADASFPVSLTAPSLHSSVDSVPAPRGNRENDVGKRLGPLHRCSALQRGRGNGVGSLTRKGGRLLENGFRVLPLRFEKRGDSQFLWQNDRYCGTLCLLVL